MSSQATSESTVPTATNTEGILPTYNLLPLDVPLVFNSDELVFFLKRTGLPTEDALAAHVKAIQAKAYAEVFPYPCIRRFNFCKFKVRRMDIYPEILERGKKEGDAVFLDLGCCFGTDVRSVVDGGYPAEFVIGSDLSQGFIDLGHELFLDTPSSPSTPTFLAGDIFSPAFYTPTSATSPHPPLNTLTSLSPLSHQVRHIHCGSLFHLFSRSSQRALAQILASLLLPKPGSTAFGSHAGRSVEGVRGEHKYRKTEEGKEDSWAHSPTSWTTLWKEVAAEEGIQVKVTAQLVDRNKGLSAPALDAGNTEWLVWSVVVV